VGVINGDPSAPLPGWFGLSDDGVLENPSDPHSDNPYHSDGYETVCHEMLAAINRREPMLLLTGEAGVGKTTVCRAVIEQLDARTIPLLITERPRSLDDLLRTILSEFGVISGFDRAASLPPAPSTAALADALGRFLRSLDQVTAFVVVFIDNAQFLPLDLLREIGSLELPARRLTIALVGHSALVRALQRRDLRDLDRRITSRHELGPLTEGEVSPYIAHRARVAGEKTRAAGSSGRLAVFRAESTSCATAFWWLGRRHPRRE
jgi:type II secretory pathway predicted ATPase ExeA